MSKLGPTRFPQHTHTHTHVATVNPERLKVLLLRRIKHDLTQKLSRKSINGENAHLRLPSMQWKFALWCRELKFGALWQPECASQVAQLVKNPPAMQETWFNSQVGKICWERERLPTPVFLGFPGGSAGNNLEGWDGVEGGREVQEEGTYVYLWLIHGDVWQKPTRCCKAIILHLNISKFK